MHLYRGLTVALGGGTLALIPLVLLFGTTPVAWRRDLTGLAVLTVGLAHFDLLTKGAKRLMRFYLTLVSALGGFVLTTLLLLMIGIHAYGTEPNEWPSWFMKLTTGILCFSSVIHAFIGYAAADDAANYWEE